MKNIVKYTTILLLLLVIKSGFAQHHPRVYNIYTQSRFLYNPAHASDFGQAFLDVKESVWGVDGHQEMFTFGIHSAIGDTKKSGLGLYLVHDKFNVIGRTTVNASYSYAAKLNQRNTLSFGVGLGIFDGRYDQGEMLVADPSEIIGNLSEYETTRLDARFGINYNWDRKLNIGFTLPEILTDEYTFNQHFLGIASYKFYALREKMEIEPSVLYRHHMTDYTINQIDANLYMCVDQTLWLQGGYRFNPGLLTSGFILGGGVNLEWVGLGYAYEYGMGNGLNVISNGTHEVQLSIFFDKERRKNNNAALLNNNQLEMMVDSVEENMDDYYRNQIDSLRDELDDLNNAMKLKQLAEFTDEILDRIRQLDEQKTNDMKQLDEVIVFFDVNKYNVKSEYFTKLDKYADDLKTSGQSVTIHGYADETGDAGYNKILSEKRANAVKDYLVRKGVSASKLSIQANGETTNFGVSLESNRRVEFK